MNEYFLSLARELLSKYQRINTFTPHTVSVGRYHEEALKSTLKLFLPSRFSIKTGFVHIPKQKATSRQCDLIIIDENEPNSYLFQDGEFVIVHPEAVVCVIEVKTRIDKKEFLKIHQASKALADVRKQKRGFHRGCLYVVFGYNSTVKSFSQLDKWYKDLAIDSTDYDRQDYPANITMLQGSLGLLQLDLSDPQKWGMQLMYKEAGDLPEWRLALFLMCIRTMTEKRDGKNQNFSNEEWNVDFTRAKVTTDHLQIGKGAIR